VGGEQQLVCLSVCQYNVCLFTLYGYRTAVVKLTLPVRAIDRFMLSVDRAALPNDHLFVSSSTGHPTIDR